MRIRCFILALVWALAPIGIARAQGIATAPTVI